MPKGDRTGPLGMGPMTGRAAGYCAGYPVPGYLNPWWCRGFWGWGRGRGGGGGRGWRHWFYATGLPGWLRAAWGWPPYGPGAPAYPWPYGAAAEPEPEQELKVLRQQAAAIQKTLEEINERIAELESQSRQS